MRNLVTIKKRKRLVDGGKREVVKTLAKMVTDHEKAGRCLPPVDLLRRALEGLDREDRTRQDKDAGWEEEVGLGRAFLEVSRVQEFAEGLASSSRLDKDIGRAEAMVILYLLTGHLRPENKGLIHRFLSSAEFASLASAVYALDRLAPIDRHYYEHLFKKNLYSKEFVDYWSSNAKTNSGYAWNVTSTIKASCENLYGTWMRSFEKSKSCLKLNVKKNLMKSFSRLFKEQRPQMTLISGTVNDSRVHLLSSSVIRTPKNPPGEERLVEKENIQQVVQTPTVKKRQKKIISQSDPKVLLARKYLDTTEMPSIKVEQIEARDKMEIDKLNYAIETRTYNKKGRLLKKRTDFKNIELLEIRQKHDSIKSFRTNAATLLKEAAIILNVEEEENKKLLDLIVGSSNYLEYEEMITERINEEEELFKVKIQKLHLEGKLTEQSAILAKLRLQNESKQRRKEFEEEKNKLLEEMHKLKQNEVLKINTLVGKVKEIRDRIATKKKSLENKKRQAVEKLAMEIRKSLAEAMENHKKELEKKVLIIKEVRAFEAFKRSLKSSAKFMQEPVKPGLLCEMSLEELEERKKYMKSAVNKELDVRKKKIMQEIKSREILLDSAEIFIRNSRSQRQKRRKTKPDTLTTENVCVDGVHKVPDTFHRRVPIVYEKELLYKTYANEIRGYEKGKQLELMKQNKRYENNSKIDMSRYEIHLNNYLKTMKNNDLLVPQEKETYEHEKHESRLLTYSHALISSKSNASEKVKKNVKEQDKVLLRSTSKTNVDFQEIQLMDQKLTKKAIWGNFKLFIKNFTNFKLPKKVQIMPVPPKSWMKNLKKLSSNIGRISTSRIPFQRRYKPTWRLTKKKIRRRKNVTFAKKVNFKKKSKDKWAHRWQRFYKALYTELKFPTYQTLEKLNDDYTKKIIKQINYYNNVTLDTGFHREKQSKSDKIKKYRESIMKLKAQFNIGVEKVREAKKEIQGKSVDKQITEPTKIKPLAPSRKRLVLPYSNNPINELFMIRNLEERVIQIPLFESEDREIREAILEPPIKDETETKLWVTDRDHEKPLSSEVLEQQTIGKAIHLWEIPKMRAKRISKEDRHTYKKVKTAVRVKYSFLKNVNGNPIFTLKPSIKYPLKWEWHPIKIKEPYSLDVAFQTNVPFYIQDLMTPRKSMAIIDFIVRNSVNNESGLIGKLQALRIRECDTYMRSLKGKERTEYFKNVPIKMILDYMRTDSFGGDPFQEPKNEY